MSTVCKICINAPQREVIKFLENRLITGPEAFSASETDRPLTAIEHDKFLINDQAPFILSCKQVTGKTTEIHFNSFSKMKALTSSLSKALGRPAVVNIYQSTAMACYWSYFLKGDQVREIETGDSEILTDTGLKFGFEEDNLGHNIADYNEAPCYHFDSDDMGLYNQSVGIDVEVYQQYDGAWKNFRIKHEATTTEVNRIPGRLMATGIILFLLTVLTSFLYLLSFRFMESPIPLLMGLAKLFSVGAGVLFALGFTLNLAEPKAPVNTGRNE